MLALKFRSAERSIVYLETNNGGMAGAARPYSYSWFAQDWLNAGEQSDMTPVPPKSAWLQQVAYDEWTPIQLCYGEIYQSTYAPHGPGVLAYTPDGTSANINRFVWQTRSEDHIFQVNKAEIPSGSEVIMRLNVFNSSGVAIESQVSAPVTSGVGTEDIVLGADFHAYASFDIKAQVTASEGTTSPTPKKLTEGNDNNLFTISNFGYLQSSGSTVPVEIFSHRSAPGFWEQMGNIKKWRTNTASLRYMNTSATLALAGAVAEKQVDAGQNWFDFPGNWEKVQQLPDIWERKAVKGSNIYLRKTLPEDEFFESYTVTRNGILCDSFVPIVPKHDYALAYFNAGSAFEGQTGQWIATDHSEFTTDSQFFAQGVSNASFMAVQALLPILNRHQQCHQNDDHIATLTKAIEGMGGSAVDFINHLGTVLDTGGKLVETLM